MKPRIGCFSFSSCEGCQLMLLNLEQELLDLLQSVEFVNFREAIDEKSSDYTIAFVEGSITRDSEKTELMEIRDNADFLIAFGSCATLGGINALKNLHALPDTIEKVYGDGLPDLDSIPTKRIRDLVVVDYEMHGCPVDKKELLTVIKKLLLGVVPRPPGYSVCTECKMRGTQCLYELGQVCIGAVTRGGCNAICPAFGSSCDGCRGFIDYPNIASILDVLQQSGLNRDDAIARLTYFNQIGYTELTGR